MLLLCVERREKKAKQTAGGGGDLHTKICIKRVYASEKLVSRI